MKKFTLISFVFFLGVVVAVFGYGFLFSSNENLVKNTTPIIQKTSVINNKSKNISGALTLSEVTKHSTRNDCYLIINNKVYNVSSYIGNHPGGVKKITKNCGGEVTGIFTAIHSNFAWDLLSQYYIGDLK